MLVDIELGGGNTKVGVGGLAVDDGGARAVVLPRRTGHRPLRRRRQLLRSRRRRHHPDDEGGDDDGEDDDDHDDDGQDEDDDEEAVPFEVGGGMDAPLAHPPPPHSANLATSITDREIDESRRGGGIILDADTSVVAMTKLVKYAIAGNVQAIYM
jgi:hypothetical protein